MTNQTNNGRIDTISRVIAASPEKLYQAFMNPESLVKWMPPEGMSGKIDQFEPQAGGHFRMTLTYGEYQSVPGKTTENTDVIEGKFSSLVPNQRIVTVGVFDSDEPTFAGVMSMNWCFEAIPEGTKVTIIAENVPEGIKKADHYEGLNSSLKNLANFTEEQ